MRWYKVHVFVPTVMGVEAENLEEALAKVGAYYQEQYREQPRDWLEVLEAPEESE